MKLLDLFCGPGGAGMGYHKAGFEVVGVDIAPQPSYPFRMLREDALTVLDQLVAGGLRGFDVIHASPPCQRYSNLKRSGVVRPNLIGPIRMKLKAAGLPYIIENVEGSPLLRPVRLCGTAFGRPLRRHRLFESNLALMGVECRHQAFQDPIYPTQDSKMRDRGHLSTVVQPYGHTAKWHLWKHAMDMPWVGSRDELSQAIPPYYTEYLGGQVAALLGHRAG